MIDAESYRVIFDIIVTIATLAVIARSQKQGYFESKPATKNGWILAAALALFIGFRPVDIAFVDMIAYAGRYDWLASSDVEYTSDTSNFIFDNLILYFGRSGYTKQFFFFVITAIYYLITFFAIKRLFKNNCTAAYIIWLGSFSTFSYGVNGIKAGAAAALFLLAISYYDKKLIALLLAIISLGFHHSMIVCIIAYLLVQYVRKPNYYVAFWLFCFIVAALHITYFQLLFGEYSDEQGSGYLMTTEGDAFGGKGGFRIDFVLYSVAPIIIGYIALIKKKLLSRRYTAIFNFYLFTNGIWMLCMYASFTNRIAYLSWFIYPIVLIYPLLEMNWGHERGSLFRTVAFCNLLFTLIMAYIY